MEQSDKLFQALVKNQLQNANSNKPQQPIVNKKVPVIENQQIINENDTGIQSRQYKEPYQPYRRPITRNNRTRPTDPEDSNSLDEQLELISQGLESRLRSGDFVDALKFTMLWIDGIVDEDEKLYSTIYDMLLNTDKKNLIKFIEVLVDSLK